jgi:hypothetical protein
MQLADLAIVADANETLDHLVALLHATLHATLHDTTEPSA